METIYLVAREIVLAVVVVVGGVVVTVSLVWTTHKALEIWKDVLNKSI